MLNHNEQWNYRIIFEVLLNMNVIILLFVVNIIENLKNLEKFYTWN